MARTDTLVHYLTDVASAIKTKKGSSDSINASNFDTEILNLPSGGGVEYESGTYTPTSNVQRPTINFTNTHTTAPTIIILEKVNDVPTLPEQLLFVYVDFEKLFGGPWIRITSNGNTPVYVFAINSSQRLETQTVNGTAYCNVSSSNEGASGPTYPRWFATKTGFTPGAYSASTTYWATFVANEQYEWKAYWL